MLLYPMEYASLRNLNSAEYVLWFDNLDSVGAVQLLVVLLKMEIHRRLQNMFHQIAYSCFDADWLVLIDYFSVRSQ